MKRTTAWHVIRLAWHLLVTLRKYRHALRIGQMLSNASGEVDVFHIENAKLLERLRRAPR